LEYKTDSLKVEELERQISDDAFYEKEDWLERTYAHNRTSDGELPEYMERLNRSERVKAILEELGHSVE
jgi:hypothetical protein